MLLQYVGHLDNWIVVHLSHFTSLLTMESKGYISALKMED